MRLKICFVYPWATYGGVERVLLSRLIAFKEAHLSIDVDLMFLQDAGGVTPLREALRNKGIEARVIVSPDFDFLVKYDLVFCIDCPQVFALCERRGFRYLAECHTTYEANRKYLDLLPASCEAVVTPSELFSNRIKCEIDDTSSVDVFVLRNFVPCEIPDNQFEFHRPGWVRKPILFLGRMDKHKDPLALLDSFSIVEEMQPGKYMCVFCGPQSPEVDMDNEIEKRGLQSKVIVLPAIPLISVNAFIKIIKANQGIFVSPSIGESFGLSAAEAINGGLPVVLSNIEEHCYLVQEYHDKFTYELGDTIKFAERILDVFDSYEILANLTLEIREKFSSRSFLDDWSMLLEKLGLGSKAA